MKSGATTLNLPDNIKIVRDEIPGLSCGDCKSHKVIQVVFIFIKSKFGDITSDPFLICDSCASQNVGRNCPECGIFNRVKDDTRDEVYCKPCGLVLTRNKIIQY